MNIGEVNLKNKWWSKEKTLLDYLSSMVSCRGFRGCVWLSWLEFIIVISDFAGAPLKNHITDETQAEKLDGYGYQRYPNYHDRSDV